MKRAILFLFLTTTFASHIAGHTCGETEIEIVVGQRATYRITADVQEAEPSRYEIVINEHPEITGVSPDNMTSLQFGEFVIEGKAIGTSKLVFEWVYAPNDAFGSCFVTVRVVPPPSQASGATAANHDQSATTGDPVNMFTGELVMADGPDIFLGGPMPLQFTRFYASRLRNGHLMREPLGPNWSHNFNTRMIRNAENADIVSYRGRVVRFEKQGTAWTLISPVHVPYQLVEAGGQWIFGDPESKLLYTYDESGRLISISDGKGNTHSLRYDGQNLAEVSDGLGRSLTFRYEGFQHLESVSDGTRTIRFGYSFNGVLNAFTDTAGNRTQYQYDPSNSALLKAAVLPRGNSHFTQIYDASGRVVQQNDAFGHATKYAYGGNATVVTDPLGFSRTYVHSPEGRLEAVTDENSNTIRYAYDTAGRLASITDREGRVTRYSFHALSGKLASIVYPDGKTDRFEYAPRDVAGIRFHDLAELRFRDDTVERITRDPVGNIQKRTRPGGNEWKYGYNERGQPLTQTNPAGATTAFKYHPDGTLAEVTDASGNKTLLAYDNLKRLAGETYADGSTQLYEKNALDRIVRKTNPRGGVWRYEFDVNGNFVRSIDPNGGVSMHAFDAMDRMTNMVDQAGATMSFAYDARGWLESITDGEGHITKLMRDPAGNLVESVDPGGHRWTRAYDKELAQIGRTNPAGQQTRYDYDSLGRMIGIESPGAAKEQFEFDSMGRVTAEIAADGRRFEVEYDTSGFSAKRGYPQASLFASYKRDRLGNVTEITDPNGNMWRRDYDAQGRLIAMIDPKGRSKSYEYDARNRPAKITYPGGAGSLEVRYDGFNAITERNYADGLKIAYDYDEKGYFIGANGIALKRDAAGQISESNGIQISRNAAGRIEQLTLRPGKTVRYQYDKRGLLAMVTDWTGASVSFEYDNAGRLIRIVRPNGVHSTFAYDPDSRITGIDSGPILKLTLTRDAAGNVTESTRQPFPTVQLVAGTNARAYDEASQSIAASYDPLGRTLTSNGRTYVWDQASRLVQLREAGLELAFSYDAMGYRLSKTSGSSTESYIWNYAWSMPSPAIIQRAGQDWRYCICTPGGNLLYTIDAVTGAHQFYHFDETGNTLLVTADSGESIASYLYSPYGEVLAGTGNFENPFTFQGQYGVMAEESSGLYYMRARYYDGVNGRFLTPDPLKTTLPRAINPYQYALGNPLRYNDPFGLQPGPVEPVPESTPTGTQANPIYLSRDEWETEVTRMKNLLKERAKIAEWGMYDPTIPGGFDSVYLRRQREFFDFRGEVMNGGELNYYFQGMYWAESGVPKTVMIAIIHSYKQYKYGRGPSDNDLFAACQGFEDNGNFITEVRDEFVNAVDDLTSIPRNIKNTVVENAYSVYHWFNPPPPQTGPPGIYADD